jgi:predicted TIM-barrel fold metal-dependent hydrolase
MSVHEAPRSRYPTICHAWLDGRREPALDPDRRIVDPHHHFWDRPGSRYHLQEFLADMATGHRVVATVYVECGSFPRAEGPPELRPVGEIEFAVAAAEEAARLNTGTAVCAAIVAGPDLTLGEGVDDVLDVMAEAAEGRLRGVRNTTAWHADPEIRPPSNPPPALLRDSRMHAGIARVRARGLALDIWNYHTHLDEVRDLARSFPDLPIVLDHVGGLLGIGPFAHDRDAVVAEWSSRLGEVARCENVFLKFGGRGMRVAGARHHERPLPPSSEELAQAWAPVFNRCMDAFGPQRCLFESNFPVDKSMFSYAIVWNAFKRLAARFSEDEKDALFHRTASRIYQLGL